MDLHRLTIAFMNFLLKRLQEIFPYVFAKERNKTHGPYGTRDSTIRDRPANLPRRPLSFPAEADSYNHVLHLLYAVPILRGDTQVIEDVPALSDISIRIKLQKEIKRIKLLPEMTVVSHQTDEEGYTNLTCNVHGHRMILLET